MEGRLAKRRIGDELESAGPPPIRLVRTKQRILVADGDPGTRALVARALRRGGHDVVEASNGMEAIDYFAPTVWTRRDAFNAIVADVCMPDLTGLDLLAALRCTGFETPVILMTAFGDEEVRAEARSLGATAVLDKPFTLNDLHAALQKANPTVYASGGSAHGVRCHRGPPRIHRAPDRAGAKPTCPA